ncbi:cytochrome B5-like protein isoform X1 [Vespa mandarinia]|uniref:cytochrome B5-like protein isoform X1 n=2 Tax=Vespa mandarinia TaxID=7446 RepID=UPI00161D4DA0|nr:cytochrome B5-like protein isoform X1 [Vespa mandarinia]
MSIEKESSSTREKESLRGIDRVSLTFRALDMTDSETKRDGFLSITREQTYKTSSDVTSKEKTRRLKRNEEASRLGELRCISLDEVAWHDTPNNCWIIIYDYVYDCTELLKTHPGGQDVLLEYAGRDATLSFIGAGHSKIAQDILKRYLIGELPFKQRIFRIPNGVKVNGF